MDPLQTSEAVRSLVGELIQRRVAGPRLALRGTDRYLPRLERYGADRGDAQRSELSGPSRLVIATPGTLDGLEWESARATAPGEGEVRLSVLASGVNFRDVLLALGMYPGGAVPLGAECAGTVETVGPGVSTLRVGDLVFGFAPGSLGTEVTVPARFLIRLPETMSVEDAAALPAAFLTAMFGLQEVARIQAGARVLIHAAAGGVGLAAVQVARRRGAIVFATAGSPAKRKLLRSLGVEHVFDSRSLAFADEVLAATGGAGVDVVLNSLAGEFIAATLATLAPGGWFLELGKRDILTREAMAADRPDVRYRPYDFGDEARADASLVPRLLDDLCTSLEDGSFRPLPVRAFGFAQAAEAFRFMAQARHVGKLVLRAPRTGRREDAPFVVPDAVYLITGGTGALGIRTAQWLVDAGARHVVLTARRPPSPEAERIIGECVAAGAQVSCRQADAGDEAAMAAVFDEIRSTMPPLRGVVHAAGIVDDGMLVQQTWTRWRAVMHGKAVGARILDAQTRNLPLDFFVLYSAAALVLGSRGQGAYAAANAELDAIAWARRTSGLAALSIAWGQWREAGMAARMVAEGADPWSKRGLGWIAPREGFMALERLMRDGATYAAVLPIDWRRFLAHPPAGHDAEFFRAVAPFDRETRSATPVRPAPAVSVVDGWRSAPSGERRSLLLAHLAERARHVLGVEATFVLDERVPLKDVGLDSLMAVELRNVLTRSMGTSLPATLLFDYPSLGAMASFLTGLLHPAPDAPAAGSADPSPESVAAVAALTDDEAEALLLAELDGTTGSAR